MLCSHRLRLADKCWAWGLAPSWPEHGQDSFCPTLLINETLIQGCITLCCSLCSHAQPLCVFPALGRTVLLVSNGISPASRSNGSAGFGSVQLHPLCSDALPAICCYDALCVDIWPLLSLTLPPLIPHSCTYCPPPFPSIACYHLSACALSHSLSKLN